MLLAALFDLGVPVEVVTSQLQGLGLSGWRLEVQPVLVGALAATHVEVVLDEPQPLRDWAEIRVLLESAPLSAGIRERALAIFGRIAKAEAQVHGVSVDSVHFHEVGAVDSIVDIVGVAAALDYLGADLSCRPLPMGRGWVRCQHGLLPLPAPATLLCLQGVPTEDAGIEAELVTPTGAGIVASLCHGFSHWPSMTPDAVGLGAGTRRLPDRPNVLRIVLGEPLQPAREGAVVMLAANLDDLTGELAAHVQARLMEAGALDAWVTQVLMKKGRPGLVLEVLCERAREDALASLLLTESTTLGVRRWEVERTVRPRRLLEVPTEWGPVAVKVSGGPYGPAQIKPEFESCRRLAEEHGVPLRLILERVTLAAAALREQLDPTAPRGPSAPEG